MGRGSGQTDGEPLTTFQFKVKVAGTCATAGFFTEVSGIGSENEVIDQKVVDESGREFVKKIPGRLKWTDVTLKRGLTTDQGFWKWRQAVQEGRMGDARATVTISLLDRDYKTELAIWNLERAWPSKLTGPSVKADSNELGIEEITIVHEGMTRQL